jgi:thiol-disulfide isomerase/thioredoxin
MRRLWALVLIALIVIPMQSSAATESLWDDARINEIGVKSGTIGGVSIELSNTTYEESESGILDLPSIVEVYTATWCSNCIKTEQALEDAIGDLDVTRIHYHRHLYETLDPFGSNSTDSRWVETYGTGSLLSTERSMATSDGGVMTIPGTERSAPSKVFDGERMYTGISTKSNSLLTDYIGLEPPLRIQRLNFPRSYSFHGHSSQRSGRK